MDRGKRLPRRRSGFFRLPWRVSHALSIRLAVDRTAETPRKVPSAALFAPVERGGPRRSFLSRRPWRSLWPGRRFSPRGHLRTDRPAGIDGLLFRARGRYGTDSRFTGFVNSFSW